MHFHSNLILVAQPRSHVLVCSKFTPRSKQPKTCGDCHLPLCKYLTQWAAVHAKLRLSIIDCRTNSAQIPLKDSPPSAALLPAVIRAY